jgi:hypothetical protein
MIKRKRTNNDLQYITQKTKDRATRTPLKTGSELRCPRRASGSCSTSVTLVKHSVISDRIVITIVSFNFFFLFSRYIIQHQEKRVLCGKWLKNYHITLYWILYLSIGGKRIYKSYKSCCLIPFANTWVGSVLLIFLVFFCVLFYCVSLRSEFRVVMSVTISALKQCSVRFYRQLFVGGLMSYLRYLCLLTYSGVHHILCCVFVLFFFVLCTLCCQFLWIVHFWLPLRFSLTFIYR